MSDFRNHATEHDPWKVTLLLHSSLKQEAVAVASLWPLSEEVVRANLAFRDVLGFYRLSFESPTGGETILPFSSLDGLVAFLHGTGVSAQGEALTNSGSLAWWIELAPGFLALYRCDLRLYDRYVDRAESFAWLDRSLVPEEKAGLHLKMRADRSALAPGLFRVGQQVVRLVETCLEEELAEQLLIREAEGMQGFYWSMSRSSRRRLREMWAEVEPRFKGS